MRPSLALWLLSSRAAFQPLTRSPCRRLVFRCLVSGRQSAYSAEQQPLEKIQCFIEDPSR